MGDRGAFGGGGLEGLAAQWGGSPPVNDYSIVIPSTTKPPANTNRRPDLEAMSHDELTNHHTETVKTRARMLGSRDRIEQMKTDPVNRSYDEARIRQAGLDDMLARYDRLLNDNAAELRTQAGHMQGRGLSSNWWHFFPEMLRPQGGISTDMAWDRIPGAEVMTDPSSNENDPKRGAMLKALKEMTDRLGAGQGFKGDPSGNPMTPLVRPPLIGLEHRETEQPSGLPRIPWPVNRNEPPVE